MSRVDKFKETRRFKIKCLLVLASFLVLVSTGICVSDYSINALMHNQKRIEIVKVDKENSSDILLSFLNIRMGIETQYITRDIEYVKSKFKAIFGQ